MNSSIQLMHGDCLELLPTLPAHSIDLILTDPPYFKVKKGEAWDRQWKTPQAFLGWLDCVLAEFQRVLKPNGSLYLFASPEMSARVECLIGERFQVLNQITWSKSNACFAEKYGAENFRQYVPMSERIIFAEQFNANNTALGVSHNASENVSLRNFVFEPIRAYLDKERKRAGLNFAEINTAWCDFKKVNSTSQTQKWFTSSCFNPPTQEAYYWLRKLFNASGGEYLCRDYEELRREYEGLQQQYRTLRRPFCVSADVFYTDVWTFKTVQPYPGKHPCEKPQSLLQHIINASSRQGATVLDAFMGGGSCGVACQQTMRNFIGMERDETYYCAALNRINHHAAQKSLELAGTP